MKRFTETLKWEDQWFRRLPLEMKALWCWILDKCDNAGVIDPDLELASFQIGYQYPMDTLSGFSGRVLKLPNGKHFIPKFIPFQYGKLSVDCRAHGPVFLSLEKNGVDPENLQIIGYSYPMDTLQYKEEDKVKEKDSNSLKSKRTGISASKGSLEDMKAYSVEIGFPESDGESMFDHWESNGWRNGSNPVKDWKAGIRKWKSQGWLPSQKGGQISMFPTTPTQTPGVTSSMAAKKLAGADIDIGFRTPGPQYKLSEILAQQALDAQQQKEAHQ